MIDREVVSVGDVLGVVEEFIPGNGTYESNGKIISTRIGKVRIDKQKLEISVDPLKKLDIPIPKVGDIVVGEVVFTRKQKAMVKIFKVGKNFLFDTYPAILHVSNMSREYLKSVDEGFKPTDIVRGKIIKKKLGEYELETKGRDLGVLYAECSNCGTYLVMKGHRLECSLCGAPNPRKCAPDYGKVRERQRIENLG